jgi:hypothetical protein
VLLGRSLTPDPETLAAIVAASSGGAPPAAATISQGAPCGCSLCAAAQEACGGALGPTGCFFGGGLCGIGSCAEDRAPAGSPAPSPLQTAAAGLAAPGITEASRHASADGLAALQAADSSSTAAGAAPAAAPWWRQGRCQLQFAVLLLLSIANISVSCCISVLERVQGTVHAATHV